MALTLGEISQGNGKGLPTFTLVLRDPMLLCSVVPARGPVLPADAYFRRQIDIEAISTVHWP
ncbi:hypothetical protein [Hydrogenophaga sp. PAMC20947]|uniref:hypothetical protein n=1 Tax=Hydrogenophaga sp. PAMC20947 TaxID=2565558 RepID=UPI00109DD872|nr:hypothetical protein [Hydrogenophaga sp. PAMC20947]QCB44664.1 hypothetical protein E5678_00560 [Hydrogenophaga sp. PAMC20947]